MPQEPNNQWGQQATAQPLSDNAIQSLQGYPTGSSHPLNQGCNGDSANGVTQTATFNGTTEMAGTTAGTMKSFVIGSDYTAKCMSRFGAQDMAGNVSSYVSDEMFSVSNTSGTGGESTLDQGNRDFVGYNFDGVTGPGGSTYSSGAWNFNLMKDSAVNFLAPLGLAMVGTDGGNALAIGTALELTRLHDDVIQLALGWEGTDTRAPVTGGNWGAWSGRFTIDFYSSQQGDFAVEYVGASQSFRCALPAQ
jgi:hypothetical protein